MRTEEMMKNPSSFAPVWMDEWQPSPEMLDFEEKWRAFHTPDGRLMSCAHRGDRNKYYPENSLEGFLSCIMAGADILEVDIHTTKDGVLVIMHDGTVTRTTNVTALREAGEDWMPETDSISDWTFEQLRRLRLITLPDKAVTEYAIPSLRELITLAKNRCFITLDKINAFSWEEGIAPLLDELDAYRTVLIPYNYDIDRAYALRQNQLRTKGLCCPFFAAIGEEGGIMSETKMQTVPVFLREHDMPPALRGGEYWPEQREKLEPYVSSLKGNHRIYAETLRGVHDNREHWEQMLEIGYNIIMGNKIYDVLKMIEELHFA